MKIYRHSLYHLKIISFSILLLFIPNYITQHPYWQKNSFLLLSHICDNKTCQFFYLIYIYIIITVKDNVAHLSIMCITKTVNS